MQPEEMAALATAMLIISEALSQTGRVKSNSWIDLFKSALRGIAGEQEKTTGKRWFK
jgi:hypothetical protein